MALLEGHWNKDLLIDLDSHYERIIVHIGGGFYEIDFDGRPERHEGVKELCQLLVELCDLTKDDVFLKEGRD